VHAVTVFHALKLSSCSSELKVKVTRCHTCRLSGMPIVIACCRDANEDKQPQSRYSEVASKGKESFQENNATNLYQNANKSANAAADRGKDKAQDKARKDS
jgi:hypothetical protein